MSAVSFSHAERGLTRFPPNVEQISVDVESPPGSAWLRVRRNDTELRFPLNAEDCRHLARLCQGAAAALDGR